LRAADGEQRGRARKDLRLFVITKIIDVTRSTVTVPGE
jgi:hypothetical protein